MDEKRTASIYPTADEINALPEKVQRYIHDLVSRCDKSGDVQTIAILREDRDALALQVEELKAEKQRKSKQNPHCPVRGCKGKTSHQDDQIVAHLMTIRKDQPALLAAYNLTALRSLRDSVRRDVEQNDIFSWISRSRQVEEIYVGAIYALLVAAEEDVPHYFSEMPPNGLSTIYKQVNKDAFAGRGRLNITSDDPELKNLELLSLFNRLGHVSHFSQLLTSAAYQRIEMRAMGARFLKRIEDNCYALTNVVNDFTTGKTRDEIRNRLRSWYEQSIAIPVEPLDQL